MAPGRWAKAVIPSTAVATSAVAKAASRTALRSNTHELYCLSLDELDEVVVHRSQETSGVRQTWQEFKGIVEGVAG